MLLVGVLVQCLAIPLPAAAQQPDSAATFRKARDAEKAYLSAIRFYAPFNPNAPTSGECDEIVGRFCITYSPSSSSLPDEPKRIAAARATAIADLEAAFAIAPASPRAAFPLVRFLIAVGRKTDALRVARAHARARPGPESHMIVGYALNANGMTVDAAAAFESWLAALPHAERNRIKDIKRLLKPEEGARYTKMAVGERAAFEKLVWRFADPLFLTPGNEAWTEHVSRHAIVRLMADAPAVSNNESWGPDVEQILIRYGEAYRTTRSFPRGSVGGQPSYTEHWDRNQRTYVPAELAKALSLRARPDTSWMLDTMMTRSGHSPRTIRSMYTLQHQAVVFPDSAERLLVTASARLDSLSDPKGFKAVTWLLDRDLEIVGMLPGTVTTDRDSVWVRFEGRIPESANYYSAEILDTVSRFAARARYGLLRPSRAGSLAISGLFVSAAYRPDAVVPRPVIKAGSPFGIFAEAQTAPGEARPLNVEIETIDLDRSSMARRMAGWVGRSLGLTKPESAARMGWKVETEPNGRTPIAVTIDAGALEMGRYLIKLTVSDQNGSSVVAEREVLVTRGETLRP